MFREYAQHDNLRSGDASRDGSRSAKSSLSTTLFHILSFFLLPLVSTLPAIPGIVLILNIHERFGGYWFLAASLPAAISFILLTLLEIAALKWLLVGRVKAGTYPIDSFFYARKRFVDQLMDMSLKVLGPVYATLYLNPWFRLLGAKIGRRAEVSTSHNLTHDLFTAGEGSFFADSTSLGAPRFEAGQFTLAPVTVGERTFIGNSAVLNPGDTVGDNCLIGVLSQPPGSNTTPGTSWLGSPAIFLPQRMTTTHQFSETTTYNPTPARYAARLSIEFFRITLPIAFGIALTSLLFHRYAELESLFSPLIAAAIFPALFICAGFMAAAIVIAAKWILIGTYKPGEYPLWSCFVWRTELLTALHEHLADPFLIRLALGTPLAPWFFRMLGSKIGKRVFMDTTSLTEFDLITIGDDVCLNQDSVVQTHLFEDREMKTDRIAIGDGVSVGSRAIVLYDSAVRAGTTLDDLSLVMRGESLPPNGTFRGVPARRA
jgi:non-ribosomal peptide synthetase-like protein